MYNSAFPRLPLSADGLFKSSPAHPFVPLSHTPPFAVFFHVPRARTYTSEGIHAYTDPKMYRASAYMNNIADANTQDISNICEDRDYHRDLLPHLLITRICNFVNKSDLHSSLRHLAHPRFELIDPAHCPPFFVPAKSTKPEESGHFG